MASGPCDIYMPQLGLTMTEGTVVRWLKAPGDTVARGEPVVEIETDKVTTEVEAPASGVLGPILADAGAVVPIGGALSHVVTADEGRWTKDEGPTTDDGRRTTDDGRPVTDDRLPVSGFQPSASGRSRPVTPRARRKAAELGVELAEVEASGPNGRIVEADVRYYAEVVRPAATAAQAAPVMPPPAVVAPPSVSVTAATANIPGLPPTPGDTVTPIGTVRRLIAERMARSSHTAAPVTLTTEADATELVRLRRQLKAAGQEPLPSYTDLLAKLVATALTEHPGVNARFERDTIIQAAGVHIGLAVDTERGLLVPVLRDVQAKSLRQIAVESRALIERVRGGRSQPDELAGGTFTITNLGMYDVDAFTPIINLPECAILGVGRIIPKQVVIDAEAERVAIRHMVFLSLTFDHRLVDGAPAARFLQRVRQYVAQPYLGLTG